jgi:EAL domain-containing protein (putative c-di-GMP-specific phosphodiesterase class I)
LEYQPIVAIRTGRTAGFEALVRWEHPTRGLIRPDEFIDLAEETGLIEPIGTWVLENALAAAAQWRRHGAGPYVSINVSARQFRTPGFVERVALELAAVKLPASAVMLEITESLLLRDDERVWSDLGTLRDLGVRVAIDDFGTGYSSLSYLGQTPIDVLKIDRSFVATIAGSGRQRALIDGVVRLAETLDLQVIAEGVETRADRDLLAEIGCPYGQGYLFDRPLNARDAMKRLAEERADLAPAPAPARV